MAYLNKENLIKDLKNNKDYKRDCNYKKDIDLESLINYIEKLPTADVQEVKHSKWIANNLEIAVEYTCSICGYTYCEADPKYPPENYCCKCGAKMDLEADDK